MMLQSLQFFVNGANAYPRFFKKKKQLYSLLQGIHINEHKHLPHPMREYTQTSLSEKKYSGYEVDLHY